MPCPSHSQAVRQLDGASNALLSGRFNERMVLSLASNTSCLLVDDELNILPTSSHVKSIEPLPVKADGTLDVASATSSESELKGLADSLADTLV